MAVFLGTWELGHGYGHIAHLMPLALALKSRGHRMAMAARNPATARAAHGTPFAEIFQPPLYRATAARRPTLTYAQVIADGGFADPTAMVELVKRWLAVFDRLKPDAVVAEHAPASVLAAHVAGVRTAMIGAGWVVPPAEQPLPSLMPWHDIDEAARTEAGAAADEVVRVVCRLFGAPALDGLVDLIARTPRYLTTLPELDPSGPRRGATYYGPMGGFHAPDRAPWPGGDGPRAFAYLPFEHAAAPGLAAALGQLGWPTVWHYSRAPRYELPPNVVHAPQPVDLVEALADTNLLISRGGHSTSCEAMMAGRANLVLPDTLDTMLVARRLSLARLGRATTATEAPALRDALESLLGDRDVAAALAAMRQRYMFYQPGQATAQLADRLLGDLGL